MAVQNHHLAAALLGKALRAEREVDLLAGVVALVEAAEAAERRGLAEDERARRPARAAAHEIPRRDPGTDERIGRAERHRDAAGERAFADLDHEVFEQLPARIR